jgi:hypothetical protein
MGLREALGLDQPEYLAGPVDVGNGRVAWVVPMTFGKGRIIVGERNAQFIDNGWCYETAGEAILALAKWDGSGEPEGWMRNPFDGRRRLGGDKDKEYNRP